MPRFRIRDAAASKLAVRAGTIPHFWGAQEKYPPAARPLPAASPRTHAQPLCLLLAGPSASPRAAAAGSIVSLARGTLGEDASALSGFLELIVEVVHFC